MVALIVVYSWRAQILMTRGLKLLPAGSATAIMYLQIVFSALWGVLFLAELPDRWTVAGSLSILLGTVIAVRSAAAPAARAPCVMVAHPGRLDAGKAGDHETCRMTGGRT